MQSRKKSIDRDAVIIGGSALLFIVGAVLLTLMLMRPAPPDTIVLATGSGEEAYHSFGEKYRDILAREGVDLQLRPSAGAVDNLRLLTDPEARVDVAFVQGGVATDVAQEKLKDLDSLGSLYYQVVWVFYRGKEEITSLLPLAGKSIAIGREGSGTSALAMQMLEANGIAKPPTTVMKTGGEAAASLLQSGGIDAAFFVADYRLPVIQRLLRDRNIRLLSFRRADAYVRQHFYLNKLVLPQGVVDLAKNIPSSDVVLLGTTANLVVKRDLHPALAYLLLNAATEIHGNPTIFSGLRRFPAADDSELPLSPEASRFYKSGVPLLQKNLPYWLANLVDRMMVLILPSLVVLLPAIKLLPGIYRWRVRSRIYRWYAKLKEIELELDEPRSREELEGILQRLDDIESAVNQIPTPLAYSENLYAFRQHIDLVRVRARGKTQLREVRAGVRAGA
jgi:TRAP transporter TAXI family solute receptor